MESNIKIAVIGLEYIGLALARLLATRYAVIGFDINKPRIAAPNAGHDSTLEVEDDILQYVLLKVNPVKGTLEAGVAKALLTGLYCST